jgi:hypothetical protein
MTKQAVNATSRTTSNAGDFEESARSVLIGTQ